MTQTQMLSAPSAVEQLKTIQETAMPEFGVKTLPEGTIFLASPPHLDGDLLDYCIHLNETLQRSTVRQYLYEIKILLDFLVAHGISWDGLTERVLREYREYRTNPASDSAVGLRSWRRSGAAIKGFLEFMQIRGRITTNPAPRINGQSVLAPRARRYPTDIRSVSLEKLQRFMQEGLAAAPSHGLSTRLRNRALVELMLKTGMRVNEASNLTLPELNIARSSNGVIELEAVAKNHTLRRITIPTGAISMLRTYVMTERVAVVDRCQERLQQREDLFDVNSVEGDKVRGTFRGKKVVYRLSKLPIGLRIKAVRRRDAYIEPLGVFLGIHNGLPLGPPGWHKVFRSANRRLQAKDPTWQPIRTHDLRHTYASNALAAATALAVRRNSDQDSLAVQVGLDPLGVVQRQLGHASPNTTAQYLRQPYVADSDLARDIDRWTNSTSEDGAE
jgi:integrase